MALGLQNCRDNIEREVFHDLRVIVVGLNEIIRGSGRVGNLVTAAIDIAAVIVASFMPVHRRRIWDRLCRVVCRRVCWWFAEVGVLGAKEV